MALMDRPISKPLRLYLRLAFGLTWGLGLVMLLLPRSEAFGGVRQALWFASVGAPSLAGVIAARSLGRAAWSDYARRVLTIGRAWPWLVAAPALLLAFHALAGAVSGAAFKWPGWPALAAGLAASSLVDPGPFEEFGWRGFLQPLLQNRFGPNAAAALVGVIWGLWHLPVLVLPDFPQHDTTLPLALVVLRFVVQTTGLAVLIGYVVNWSRGGVLVAMLCHWAANQGASGLIWRFDATSWTLVVAAAAALLVSGQGVGIIPRPTPVRQHLQS